MTTILFEPDPIQATLITEYIGSSVTTVESAEQLFETLDSQKVGLLICEYQLGDHNCFDILNELRSYSDLSDLIVVLLTNTFISSSVLQSKNFKRLRVARYLYKPNTTLADLKRVTAELQA
jgi:response regulator RpfG family c-di-GMP phosphodiesterase